jgi:hypothetical protein
MIDKLVPRYLNKDDDARLVKSIEMTDALNVRLSADTDGDAGVIKNAFGNSAISFASGNNWQGLPHALPEDVNKVVGSVTDQKNGIIIFFVWNDENDHSIYMFSTSKGFAELVYRDSVLGFTANGFVKADVINTVTNEILVYFTDGETPPKKLNISRALTGGYSSVITSGTDEQKLEFLTLAKKPPLDPPTYEFFTDTTYDDNNIYESNFQFSYQYVYFDGEYSAISKYTDLAVAPNQYLDGFIEDAQRNEYNAIRVFVETSTADVKTIRVLGRRGNAGPWFIVGEVTNPALSSPATLYADFRNDELYRFISQDEANKIYDAVPFTAQSQTISGSRLFLGNYSEGYPNVDVKVSLYPNYDKEATVYDIPTVVTESPKSVPGASSQNSVTGFYLDLNSMAAVTFASDTLVHVDLTMSFNDLVFYAEGAFVDWVELDEDLVRHNAGALIDNRIKVQMAPLSITYDAVLPSGSTINDVADAIRLAVVGNYSITLDSDTTDSDYGCYLDGSNTQTAIVIGNGGVIGSDIRWAFFRGLATFPIVNSGLNASNQLQFGIPLVAVSVSIKSVTGGSILSPNLQRQYNVDTSGTITTNGLSYTRYTRVETEGDDDNKFVVPKGSGTSATANYILGYKFVGNYLNTDDFTKTYEVPYSSSFASDEVDGSKQFKSGATHELGFVLFDDRGRPTGVQKGGKVYLDWYGSRSYRGKNSIVMRLAGTVPAWAKGWAPVYTKKGSVESFVQYSVIEALPATNVQAINSPSNIANNDYIFVSFRSLEGKDDSYKESQGANLEYNFVDGDRLRVVSYQKEDGEYTFIVTSVTGTINVGDVIFQYTSPLGVSILQVTGVNLVAGAGTITARLLSGSITPSASGTFINVATGASFAYSALSLTDQKVYPSNVEFEVVAYQELTDDLNTNPVLDRSSDQTIYNTTGKFLVLRDKKIDGFSKEDVVLGSDLWSSKCIVEVYRNRKGQDEEVYYEVGKSYDVVNGILTGDRTVVSQVAALCTNARPLQFRTDVQLYAGDVLSDGSGRSFEVQNVYPEVDSIYNYFVDTTLSTGLFIAGQTYTLNITNSSLVAVELTEGDTYFRLRQLRYGNDPDSYNYFVEFVESDQVSDFYESKNTSIGRPFATLPDAKTVYRTGSVTYSEPFIIDVTRLGLSSFNPSLAPFYDLNYIHGSIRYMVNRDDSIVFLQDKKCGLFPVNRNLIEYINGQQGVTVSTSVVGTPNYYAGEYGVGNNPESVATEGGRIYFSDIRNGKVIRISQDGITPISETKMDAFFKDAFRDIVRLGTVKTVIGGVDDEAGEYIVTTPRIDTSVVTITDGSTTYTYQLEAAFSSMIWDVTSDIWNTTTQTWSGIVIAGITYDSDLLTKFSTEVRTFDDLCDEFQDSVNAVVFLDLLTSGQPAIVGAEFQGTGQTIYGVATNSSFDFFLPIILNLSSGVFAFLNDCGSFTGTQGPSSESTSGFTVGYDTDNKVWNTRYSYSPERIASLDDTLYTFQNGTMYIHDDTANRSTYYGVAYGSTVEVISNNNPSMVKAYESLSLEGTSPWAVTVTNTDQSTSILSTDFDEREREYFAYVPRDTSANTGTATITSLSGSSEMFVLGNVATSGVSGSTITFTTPVGDVAFPIGGALYKVSGSTFVTLNLTVTSISGDKSIDANGVIAGVNDGDTIVVLANAGIEGDQLRDYYAQISLTNSSTSEIELYAVNAVYAKSNLHNELGQ